MSTPADEIRELAGWVAVAAAIMSMVALADLPYGYYMLLRWVVFGAAGLGCWWLWLRGWTPAVVALALLALLFNPLDPKSEVIECLLIGKGGWRYYVDGWKAHRVKPGPALGQFSASRVEVLTNSGSESFWIEVER